MGWGAIFAIALPPAAEPVVVWQMFGVFILTSMSVFFGYGLLFSNPAIVRAYTNAKRWFDGIFAAFFGAASLKILTARLEG